jgi:hypothetical protein
MRCSVTRSSYFGRESVVICGSLIAALIVAVTVNVSSRPASAEPQCLSGVVQVLPAAKTGQAPPWQWTFANGAQGTIHRYVNTYPCVGSKINAWNINITLSNGNNFLEVGYYEKPNPVSGVDEYNIFWESVISGSVTFVVSNSPCGPFAPSGASGFRVRRFWATTWLAEVDCSNNGSWQTVQSVTFPTNPEWGNAAGEMERFSRDNSFNTWFRLLQWRRFNDPNGVWNAWSGTGCIYPPINFTSQNVHPVTPSSFDFVTGTGQC